MDILESNHMGDARYISAVAIGTMIFNSIYWLTLFLRMGTSGMTAQAFGAQDRTEVLRILQRTLFVGLFLGVLLLMLSPLLRPLLIYLMSTPPDAVVLVETKDEFANCDKGVIPLVPRLVCRHAGHTHADVGRYLPKRGQYRCLPATCRRLRMEDGGSGHRHARGAMEWGTGGVGSPRTQTSPAFSPYELSRSPGRLPSSSQGSLQPSRPPPLLRSQP